VESDHQRFPSVTTDGNAGAIIAWEDRNQQEPGIHAQRIDSAGNVQWRANGIPVSDWFSSSPPAIVNDGNGGAIITWVELSVSTVSDDMYAQRVNGMGSLLWDSTGIAISQTSGNEANPSIVSDGVGGAIVVWDDTRNPPTVRDLYAQRINSAGVTVQALPIGQPME
jgi:hypothetical protein